MANQRRPGSFWKLMREKKGRQGGLTISLGATSLYLRARERPEMEEK